MNSLQSTISHKFPSYRRRNVVSSYTWLEGRKADDNAEGLWRIHDTLYDLTPFIDKHPGGPDWLVLTKGTDITEAFEAHHIFSGPERMLEKFKVRDASKPRNYKFTFKEDGFYRTLKRRVRQQLPKINRKPEFISKIVIDSLLVCTFMLAILSVKLQLPWLAALNGLMLTWTAIASHNFFHRKDNFRMYYFNLSLASYREWRISHAMSHHLYTNSLHDLEISFFEPFLSWIPNPTMKSTINRYASWVYGPLVWSLLYFAEFIKRVLFYLLKGEQVIFKSDLVCFSVPAAMFIFGGFNLTLSIQYWLLKIIVASFMFGLIGLNAAHHHPDIVHDGDALREDMDWGLYQLDTVLDRADLRGNQLLVLTHFGDHALHHLFPTLDHGILPQLYPILFKAVEEFNADVEAYPWHKHIIGQLQQLARVETQTLTRDKRVKRTTTKYVS